MPSLATILCALLATVQVTGNTETRVRGVDQVGTGASRAEASLTAGTPWGSRCVYDGTVSDPSSQYNGRVYDPGTGFHDYGARMYWPQIGRFISADCYQGDIANPASLNRYSYVHNNPYKYTDPTGHCPQCVQAADRLFIWCESGGCQAVGNAALAAGTALLAWLGYEAATSDAVRSEGTPGKSTTAAPTGGPLHMARPKPGSRPKWVPRGTRPIDQTPWSDDHEGIKEWVGNGPADWTGITPDGEVITTDPETGEPINHGPASDMVPSGRPSSQAGSGSGGGGGSDSGPSEEPAGG